MQQQQRHDKHSAEQHSLLAPAPTDLGELTALTDQLSYAMQQLSQQLALLGELHQDEATSQVRRALLLHTHAVGTWNMEFLQRACATVSALDDAGADLAAERRVTLGQREQLAAQRLRLETRDLELAHLHRTSEQARHQKRHDATRHKKAMARLETEKRAQSEQLEALACPVCLERRPLRCLVPCGHVVCHDCVPLLREHACPKCRAPFHESCPLFL